MDRRWMYGKRDFNYMRKVDEFISQAIEHQKKYGGDEQLICPCNVCKNRKKVNSGSELRNHLVMKGFKQDYTLWISHGEKEAHIHSCPTVVNLDKQVDNNMDAFEVATDDCNDINVNDHSDDDKNTNIESKNID
ncbi:hypothetical protein vseg_018151 [Gypsophila vaccaria]